MPKEAIDFINSQRVGVLALEMMDGSPHAATVHYAFDEKSGNFLFETYNTYRKAEPLAKKEITRATFVVGFEEGGRSKTFQLDGNARILKDSEKKLFDRVYLGKFPEKIEKSKDPKNVFFMFIPTWWRYTDWHTPQGKMVITSKDK